MSKKAKHSKFKNSGILFELLTRQITSDILAGNDDSFAKTLMFKYFNENTALGKEFQLYNFIANQKTTTPEKADRVVSLVLQSRSKINNKDLNVQKYSLIKEIKDKFNLDEFLKNKINNYKLYASIYKLFENASHDSSEDYNIDELVTAKEYILENMTKTNKPVVTESECALEDQSADVKLLAYKLLIERFNTKYSGLYPEQKNLLREYITNISTINKFADYVNSEYKRIAKCLSESIGRVKHDVTKIKVKETINQLNTKKIVGNVKETHLTSLLNAYKLYNVIKSIQ